MPNFTDTQLRVAVDRAGLDVTICDRILAELAAQATGVEASGFETAHVAYYLGALLIIGAMGWFITSAWDTLSGATVALIAIAYGVIFGIAGWGLNRKPSTKIPGGVLATVAVCMVPLAVYGIEKQAGWWPAGDPGSYTGFHPYIHGSWIGMESATILVAALFLRFIRFPFITAPAAYALWYLSMDATAAIFGKEWTFHQECWISVIFGLVMIGIGFFADGESDQDFAFWFYLFGVLTFSGGLTLLGNGSQLGKAVYCIIHLAFIFVSIVLQRKVFLVFGALGVFIYLADEAMGFFRNSFSFTIALTVLGVVFIVLGILFKRNDAAITQRLSPFLPRRLRRRHALAL